MRYIRAVCLSVSLASFPLSLPPSLPLSRPPPAPHPRRCWRAFLHLLLVRLLFADTSILSAENNAAPVHRLRDRVTQAFPDATHTHTHSGARHSVSLGQRLSFRTSLTLLPGASPRLAPRTLFSAADAARFAIAHSRYTSYTYTHVTVTTTTAGKRAID